MSRTDRRLRSRLVAAAATVMVAALCVAPAPAPAGTARDVRVGTWSYPPQVSLDAQGRPAGIFIDIVQAVGARNGWHITYVYDTWEDTLARLKAGQIDLGLGVGQVPLRRAQYDLNKEPVVADWGQIYTRKDDRIGTILGLTGKTVVGWKDDRTYRSLQRLAHKFGVTARFLATDSIDENFSMVATGKADAVVDLRMPGTIAQRKYGLVASPFLFSPITFGFATTKGRNADLLREIDAYIRSGEADPSSQYNRSMDKWLGVAPEVRSRVPAYVIGVLAAAAAVAALFVGMSLLLKRQVRNRTRALRGERDMLTRLMETSPVGIVFVGASGQVEMANARAEELLGAQSAPSSALEQPAARVLETGEPVRGVEFFVDTPDGRRRRLSVNGAPVYSPEGELSGALTVFDDVTERVAAQEELERHRGHLEDLVRQRTAELQAANEQLESFSYSVSHDLRAPLRALDGFSLALLEDSAGELDEQGREHLARIRRASHHMGEIIDALLQLSRVGRVDVVLTEVDLTTMAERIAAELATGSPERLVEWRIERGLRSRADAALAGVVLENLLGNAWKFTVQQATAHIEFGATGVDGDRVFFVRDDGVGFENDYVDKLFRPFERLHTVEQFPGTGIGLATVRRAITRHSGRCWAEGALGQGATFFFTFEA